MRPDTPVGTDAIRDKLKGLNGKSSGASVKDRRETFPDIGFKGMAA